METPRTRTTTTATMLLRIGIHEAVARLWLRFGRRRRLGALRRRRGVRALVRRLRRLLRGFLRDGLLLRLRHRRRRRRRRRRGRFLLRHYDVDVAGRDALLERLEAAQAQRQLLADVVLVERQGRVPALDPVDEYERPR